MKIPDFNCRGSLFFGKRRLRWAFRRVKGEGIAVQPFKAALDYIDPKYTPKSPVAAAGIWTVI